METRTGKVFFPMLRRRIHVFSCVSVALLIDQVHSVIISNGGHPPIPAEGGASLTLRFFPPFIEVARTPVDALWLLVTELSDESEGENASAAVTQRISARAVLVMTAIP
jgi:hypothetical protein